MGARVWLGVGGYGGMVELLVHVTRVCTNSSATAARKKKLKIIQEINNEMLSC